jgi:hypothetical protein
MKRRRQLIALLLLFVLGILAWLLLTPSQPVYRGRTMSSWINSQEINDGELAQEVWKGFGSNSVPFLAKQLEARDGPGKRVYWTLQRCLPFWLRRPLPDVALAAVIRCSAADGLGYLHHPAVESAIPALVRLSKTNDVGFGNPGSAYSVGFVRSRAVTALANIGQNRKPEDPIYVVVTNVLLEAAKDPDTDVKDSALYHLRHAYAEAGAKAGIK